MRAVLLDGTSSEAAKIAERLSNSVVRSRCFSGDEVDAVASVADDVALAIVRCANAKKVEAVTQRLATVAPKCQVLPLPEVLSIGAVVAAIGNAVVADLVANPTSAAALVGGVPSGCPRSRGACRG